MARQRRSEIRAGTATVMVAANEPARMLRVRYFLCERCGTAHADVETPPRCVGCGDGSLRELDGPDGAEAYFSPPREA